MRCKIVLDPAERLLEARDVGLGEHMGERLAVFGEVSPNLMPAPALTTRWETSEVAVSVMAPMTVQLPAADCALAAFATRAISFGHSSDQKEKELPPDAAPVTTVRPVGGRQSGSR